MRNFMFTLILLLGSACSYDKPRVQVGLWAAEINGAKVEVEIVTNADGRHDLLTARVNGVATHYRGTFDGDHFDGRQPVPSGSSYRKNLGAWTIAEINREGDLVCKMLITSQIPPDTILQKTK